MAGRARAGAEVGLVAAAVAVDLLVWGSDRLTRSGTTLPAPVVPFTTAVVYLLLLVRWRAPLVVFAAQWGYGLAGLFVPGFQPFTGLLIALHAVGRRSAARPAGLALTACLVPFGIDAWNVSAESAGDPLSDLLTTTLLWAAVCGMVWGFGRLAFVSERRSQLLREAEAADAVRAERLRLARELHDSVAGAVTAMLLQAAGARNALPAREAQVGAALSVIESAGTYAMSELHRLLGLLRTDAELIPLGGVEGPPGLRDLDRVVELARASGVDVSVAQEGCALPLGEGEDLAALRVVEEALTNARKHSGGGARAEVRLVWERDRLTVRVVSTSRAAVAASPPGLSSGFGLVGLRERVVSVGGRLEARALADGYLVRAELPLHGRVPVPRPGS
jgi:signal transduction histidine kinase